MLFLRSLLSFVNKVVGWSRLRVNIILEMATGEGRGLILSIRGRRLCRILLDPGGGYRKWYSFNSLCILGKITTV